MMQYLSRLMAKNSWFFRGFLLFLLVGGILLFVTNHGDEILFFSNHRTAFTDFLFRIFTALGNGAVFFIAVILLLFWRFRTALIVALLGISVSITSNVTKKIFAEPRPYRYFEEHHLLDKITFVQGVHILKGRNSLPSGHTMTAFALFAFLAFVIPQKKWMGLLLLLLAVLVGVSRIYLVAHFLDDVYLGALTGVMLAVIFYFIHTHFFKKPWADGALLQRNKPLPQA